MAYWVQIINLSVGIAGLVLSLLGLLLAGVSRRMDRWTGRYFTAVFSVMSAYTLSNLLGQLAEGFQILHWTGFIRISIFLESLLASFLALLLSLFLIRCTGEDWRSSRLLRAEGALLLCYLALLTVTQVTTAIYYVDETGYHRGPLYPVLLLPMAGLLLLNLTTLIRRGKLLTPRQRLALWQFLALPSLAILLQMRFYGLFLLFFAVILTSLMMFLYILEDQVDHYVRQQEENTSLRYSILTSQIQPHFLFNVLTVIEELCRSDPAQAERATRMFAFYLRHNIDTLTNRGLIPFSAELQHTRNYLELEQLRFGAALQVEYDLRAEDFRLPPLTLQPLVENAVRHGVRKRPEGGIVRIESEETERCYAVTVRDTGPGFDPEAIPQDGRAHVGLKNVRQRLRYLCGGTLEVHSEPGQGSCVRLEIPKAGRYARE